MSYAPIRFEPTLQSDYSEPTPSPSSKTPIRKSIRPKRGPRRLHSTQPSAASQYPLIVHCHLCWDWVWQRPQQFISRLSRRRKVLFVETLAPDPALAAPLARFRAPMTNVTVLSLQFPAWRWPDGKYVDETRRRLVKEFLAGPGAGQFEKPLQWFYDPMAVPAFLGQMEEVLTVYDCMDELSKFRGAPCGIVERELDLLARADVVFTGGRKLFEAKRQLHHNCHFYGCGVDEEHFGQARLPQTNVPAEIAALSGPVLGYFGVVDERTDYKLLERLADANPNWSVVMVGPVVKVDVKTLPRRPNLHWLGQRAYAELPAICKGFDLCLMPFALNEATEFINPTKALEYMATGRPIVSTAVPDVVRNFGKVVQIARSPEEFVSLCRSTLARPDVAAIERGLRMAAGNSWDSIVAQLEVHIEQALREKLVSGSTRSSSSRRRQNGGLTCQPGLPQPEVTSTKTKRESSGEVEGLGEFAGYTVSEVAA